MNKITAVLVVEVKLHRFMFRQLKTKLAEPLWANN